MISTKQKRGARLGQHFLNNPVVADALIAAAGISSKDIVLEIGPGKGALTHKLLATGAHVVAIEKDEALAATLPVLLGNPRHLTIATTDVRDADLAALGLEDHNYTLAANIPYYITGDILRQFLTNPIQPSTIALLIQKEVAERIVAKDGKESLLSLSVKAYGTPRLVRKVSAGNFSPPPSVDSAIIAVSAISRNFFNTISESDFFELLHIGFGSKRKQLGGNLSKHYGKEKVASALAACGIDAKTRAENLKLEEWKSLTQHLY